MFVRISLLISLFVFLLTGSAFDKTGAGDPKDIPASPKNYWGRMVHDLVKSGNSSEAFQTWLRDAVTAGIDTINNPKMSQTVWERQINFADQYNDPGRL